MECSSKDTGVGSHSLLQGNLSSSGIKLGPPALWADSLSFEPQKTVLPAAAAKSRQSCPTLCDPIGSPPGSHPWDSPGKNTGMGCHFLHQCMKVKTESEVSQSDSSRPHGL